MSGIPKNLLQLSMLLIEVNLGCVEGLALMALSFLKVFIQAGFSLRVGCHGQWY